MAIWFEVLLINLAAFLVGLGIARLIWGREAA